jgi:hypothetical protein
VVLAAVEGTVVAGEVEVVVVDDAALLLFRDVVDVVVLGEVFRATVVREDLGGRVVVDLLDLVTGGRVVTVVCGGITTVPALVVGSGTGRKRMYSARVPRNIAIITKVEMRTFRCFALRVFTVRSPRQGLSHQPPRSSWTR